MKRRILLGTYEQAAVPWSPNETPWDFVFQLLPADLDRIESNLARLSAMVGRRLREHKLQARTLQLKLRYSDFTTLTRAHSIARATDLDTEIFEEIRELFRANWKPGATVRGVRMNSKCGWSSSDHEIGISISAVSSPKP